MDLAIDCGLVREDQLFSLDGTKIEANASFSKTRKKKEWKERQEKIVEHVDKFLEEWKKQDELEEGLEEKMREEFEKIKKKIDKIKIEEENKFHKENFIFDEENECWICPEGEKLEFMKEHLKDGA